MKTNPGRLINYKAAIGERLPGVNTNLAIFIMATVRLSRLIEQESSNQAGPRPLDRTELAVLTTLWLAGDDTEISPTWLSRSIIQTTSGMTKTLRRLGKMELIYQVADTHDRRSKVVKLTPQGAEIAESDARAVIESWSERLSASDVDFSMMATEMLRILAQL